MLGGEKKVTQEEMGNAILKIQDSIINVQNSLINMQKDTNKRFDGIDKRLDRVDERLDKVEKNIGEIVVDVSDNIKIIFEKMYEKFGNSEKEKFKSKSHMQILEEHEDRISELESKNFVNQ